ncbi:BirA family biotin operon repressor/biotin-[acetyl-CoA-carboxylase] ligase [Alkalihalobacillus xiaoxiensis]|uniref:Bifunctional ligase/repressor BirA n=1 Tax=Shouchella xiaoxiensis TaxID=766895 RepID=A0ABS2SXC6_9BACI|nr:biotin--[acetyl-CoA-carboxylase] ligase [Shouchella xiaoxiensis]MBM7840187.1 BirA family biotin operon repressor/biotin-[acetyl-CoA-carboxylase] ligase [Shouchella xiaoxiensis]
MKAKLLHLLESGKYVSGEEMSQTLGVSRTAIWKQLKALREQGYEIESAPRRGYKLLATPDTMLPHDVKPFLRTESFGQMIHYFDTVPSTQPLAHGYAAKECEEGTLVLANEQSDGKGRLGRRWQANKGQSVSMSLVLRPTIPIQQAPQLTLLAAVAVTRAIESVAGLECEIKWPNDILYKGKKLVGILTEMAADPDQLKYVIVGMGLNCNQAAADFKAELSTIATSIQAETGETVNRAKLVAQVMNEFEWIYQAYLDNGFKSIKSLWEARAISVHTNLYARTPNEVIYGYALGITDEGLLRVRDEHGKEHLIYSADIELDTNP